MAKRKAFIVHNNKFLVKLGMQLAEILGYKNGFTEGFIPDAYCLYLDEAEISWDKVDAHSLCDYKKIDLIKFTAFDLKPETIELNGKQYLKSDLEEAVKHIKPIRSE